MMGEIQHNKEKKNHDVMKICIYDHHSRKRCAYPCESEDSMSRRQKGGKEKKEGSGHVISHNIPSAKKS